MDDFVLFLYGSYNDCNWIGSGENSDCISSTRLTETIFLFHLPMVFYYSRSLEMNVQKKRKSMCVHCPVTGCVRVGQRRAAAIHRWSDIIQRTFITTSFSITKALSLRNLCLYTLLLFVVLFFSPLVTVMNQKARPLDASNPIKRTAGKMTAIALHLTAVTLGASTVQHL